MMTINSATQPQAQAQALAAGHTARGAQPQRAANAKSAAQGKPAASAAVDGDGDHGVEPSGGGKGRVVNLKA